MKLHRFLQVFRANATLPSPRKPDFSSLTYPAPAISPQRGFSFRRLAMSLSVALIGLFSVAGYWLQTTPVAAVTIDFNPSIELVVNAFHRVIEIRAENPDGEHLLTNIDYKNRSVAEVVQTVYHVGIDKGYILPDQLQYFLLGFQGDDALAESKLRQAVAAISPASTLRYLYVSKHSTTVANTWYGIGSASLSPAFNEYPASTENRNDQFVESDTLYSQSGPFELLSEAGFVNLANQLGISEAKLAIIIQILIRENQTGNMARLIQLAMTDINQLALVYLP